MPRIIFVIENIIFLDNFIVLAMVFSQSGTMKLLRKLGFCQSSMFCSVSMFPYQGGMVFSFVYHVEQYVESNLQIK